MKHFILIDSYISNPISMLSTLFVLYFLVKYIVELKLGSNLIVRATSKIKIQINHNQFKYMNCSNLFNLMHHVIVNMKTLKA